MVYFNFFCLLTMYAELYLPSINFMYGKKLSTYFLAHTEGMISNMYSTLSCKSNCDHSYLILMES